MEKLIEDYILRSDWRINENANTSFSGSGMKSYVAATILARDGLSKLPEKIRKAHKEGAIHIHDLDGGIMIPYCVSGSTGIQTPSGWKFAKDIKIGDILIGYNEKVGRFEHTKVEKVFCRETEEIYKLRLQRSDNVDVNLKITGNHKVLTNKGWMSVEELNIGDEILYLTQTRRESSKRNKIEILKVPKEKLSKNNLVKRNYSSEYSKEVASLTLKKKWKEHKNEIMEKRYSSGFYDKVSKYMKEHNPMFNKESAKKGGIKRREYYKNNPECHPNRKMAEKLFISKPQLRLFEMIKSLYPEAELEYPIKTNKTIRFADIAVPSQNIIFEYNGKYWHKDIKKDEEREKELKEQGWQVFNFYNENELDIDNIKKCIIPENGAVVISKELLKSKSVGKRNYKFKVYNFHCSPHENYLANSMIVHNCYGADLQQLMLEGLKNPVGSCSNPAKHFDSLVDHMVNYLYISQSEFNGAQAFSNVDTLLAPYVIGQDYKYVIQNIQRLIYNISYPLRSSFQTPFINFSFDLIPPKHMSNEPVVIGGKVSENMVYGDLQKEMDLINGCFLELMIKGDSMGKPFTFPIPTYGITKDVMNKNDDVTRLLYTLTAKFGSPNFQNYIKSGNDPSDVRSMCCRLRLDIAKLKSRGLWNIGNKTGSLGVCLNGDTTVRKINSKNWEDCRIYKIKVGDKLQTFVNGNIEETNVVAVSKRNVKQMMKIFFTSKGTSGKEWSITGTFEHPILLTNGEWKTFYELEIGDKLIFVRQTKFPQTQFINKLIDRKRKAEITNSIMHPCEERIMKLIIQEDLPIIWNKEISFPGAVPDFIVKDTNKLIEVDRTNGRHDVSKIKKKIYEENGYECLVLKINASDTDNEIITKIKMYLYNGATVTRKEIINGKIDGKNQFGSEFEVDKHYTVYNIQCYPYQSYISKGLVSHNCTINLNHATKDGTEHFMENVDNAYDLSIEELLIKRSYVEDAFKKGLFPFTKQYLPSFKTFFNTVGTHAMNEACLNMFESPIEENQSFVVRTLKYLRKRVDETTEETGILHNLEESPAEGATYRLAKLDRKLGLPVQGEEHPYLTNSTHCPVNTNVSWIENLRIQERFKPFYSGGTIVHGFVGEEMSPQSAEHLIKQISLNTTIPYYNLTPVFSHCNIHGHMAGSIDLCPKCGKENLIYSRVVGYIQPYQKWNDGKKSEFKDRKMYNMKDI